MDTTAYFATLEGTKLHNDCNLVRIELALQGVRPLALSIARQHFITKVPGDQMSMFKHFTDYTVAIQFNSPVAIPIIDSGD